MALGLLPALLLTGCLKATHTLVVTKEGGGTFRHIASVDRKKARAMRTLLRQMMGGLSGGSTNGAPDVPADPSRIAKDLEGNKHVRVVKASSTQDEKKHTATHDLSIAYTNLAELARSGALGDMTLRLTKTKDGHWLLERRVAIDGLDESPTDKKTLAALKELRTATLLPFKPFLATLSIDLAITLPSRILEVDGVPVTRKTSSATWRIGFADLADETRLRQAIKFEGGKDLKLEPFEVTLVDIENAREDARLRREEEERKKRGG